MRPSPQPLHQPDAVEPGPLSPHLLSAQIDLGGDSGVHDAAILGTLSSDPPLLSRLWHWPDEAACAECARALAAKAALREATIELHGPLGAGKTTFVRHLLHALGVVGRIKSPTYTVVEPYLVGAGGDALAVSHFDFYRFTDARELLDAGLRELFAAPGLKLVEWPSHAAALLPRADLRLFIEPEADDRRRVQAEALTPRGLELLA